jgi:hypothetical protein
MKTKEQIMIETFEFYSDPSNRAVRDNGGCFYRDPVSLKRCAVGRCLNQEEELEKLEHSVERCWNEIQKLLLPEYQGHEYDFWQKLQDWHDTPRNFLENEISKEGLINAKEIWERYSREPLPSILAN